MTPLRNIRSPLRGNPSAIPAAHGAARPGGLRRRAATAVLVSLAAAALFLNACARKSPAEAQTEDRPLTHDSGKNMGPHFSPDGKWIAYTAQVSRERGQFGVFLIRPEGGEPVRVPPDTVAMVALGWAEDGRSLFVNAIKEDRLLHVTLDGNILESIDRPPLSHVCDYSRSERQFLFAKFSGDNRDLGILRHNDPTPVMLAGTPGWEEDGCFGPGAGKITGVARPTFQAPSSVISIWTPGSSEVVPIPLPAGLNRYPSWSPDQRYLAYSTDRNGPADIWIFDSITTRSFQVTSGADEAVSPSWSPDGEWLAYSRVTRSSHIHLGDPITHESRQVTRGPGRDLAPMVSPDGSRLLFIRLEPNTPERAAGPALYVQSTDGNGEDARRLDLAGLVISGQEYGLFHWSPDSREVAFSADDGTGNVNIYRVAVDGGTPVQVTAGSGGKILPSWSPDGRYIGYTMTAGGETQVYWIPANGGLARQVSTQSGGVNEIIVWAPNSDDMVYLSVRPDEVFEIWRTSMSRPDRFERVVQARSFCYPMGWTKDGTGILLGKDRDGLYCLTAMDLATGRETDLGCELRDDSGKSRFIDLNEEGRKHVTCLFPGNQVAFADGDEVAEIHLKRVAELIETNLLAERGR